MIKDAKKNAQAQNDQHILSKILKKYATNYNPKNNLGEVPC